MSALCELTLGRCLLLTGDAQMEAFLSSSVRESENIISLVGMGGHLKPSIFSCSF